MSAHPNNARYAFTEIVKVTIEVEIGYDRPEGREDALQAAKSLSSDKEGGGGGVNGGYNAVRLHDATLKIWDSTVRAR